MIFKRIMICLLMATMFLPLSSKTRGHKSRDYDKGFFNSMNLGLEVAYLQPNKATYDGFTWKPAPDFSLTFRANDNWERFRLGGSIGYAPFSPAHKTFPAWVKDNILVDITTYGDVIFLGEETYSTGHYLHLGFLGEYKFLKTPLSPFVGLEGRIAGFFYSMKDTYYEASIYDEEDSDASFGFYFIPKIGMVYDIEDKMSFLLSTGGHWSLLPFSIEHTYLTVSLSAIYYF